MRLGLFHGQNMYGTDTAELVNMYLAEYSGLTIVLERPIELVKERYEERVQFVDDDDEHFRARMKKSDEFLSSFIELMAGHGEVVRSTNNA
ncbi:hypothetical protein F4678DRAFT_461628 [Xylaria arbuscula]|nr:hypothetical protein F4678DRAFT_461628 [Xylaria arbuscula]